MRCQCISSAKFNLSNHLTRSPQISYTGAGTSDCCGTRFPESSQNRPLSTRLDRVQGKLPPRRHGKKRRVRQPPIGQRYRGPACFWKNAKSATRLRRYFHAWRWLPAWQVPQACWRDWKRYRKERITTSTCDPERRPRRTGAGMDKNRHLRVTMKAGKLTTSTSSSCGYSRLASSAF